MVDENQKKTFSLRALASVLAFGSFIMLVVTGMVLFITPPGRIANWTNWKWLGLAKDEWSGLHICFAVLFLVAGIIHIWLNWRPLINYFKSRIRKRFAFKVEWLFALVLCVIFYFGALGGIPPFSSFLDFHEQVKEGWDTSQKRAPIAHGELLSLRVFFEKANPELDIEEVIARLEEKGITVDSPDENMGDLAESHNLSPQNIYDIVMQSERGSKGEGGGHGEGKGRGGGGPGRKALSTYCEENGIPLENALKALEDAGISASAEITLRDLADQSGLRPSEIVEILQTIDY